MRTFFPWKRKGREEKNRNNENVHRKNGKQPDPDMKNPGVFSGKEGTDQKTR